MKRNPLLRLLCLTLTVPFVLTVGGCGKQKPEPAPRQYNEQGYRVLPFSRGIVMSALEYRWYPFVSTYWSLKKGKTYADVRKHGFDHIRIPIDFRLGYDEEKKQMKSGYMRTLDGMLDKAEAAGLYVMLDFHGWGQMDTGIPGEKEKYLTIWREVAERYRDRSDFLIFELLNEPFPNYPGGNLDVDNLNLLQREVIGIIRESNPDRLILAAAADSNAAFRLKDMKLPRDDKNIALVVHVYDPGEFTHQGATWSDPNKTYQVRLEPAMIEVFKQRIDACRDYTKKTGVPVVINEFGVATETAAPEDVTAYLAAFTSYCEEYDIPWTYMGYFLGSDVVRRKPSPAKQAVLDGLFPEEEEK